VNRSEYFASRKRTQRAGGAEFAGQENDGQRNFRGVEIAGLENDGLKCRAGKCRTFENAGFSKMQDFREIASSIPAVALPGSHRLTQPSIPPG